MFLFLFLIFSERIAETVNVLPLPGHALTINLGELLLTIVVVVGVTAIFTYFSWRQKQSSWEGKLVKKRINRGDEDSRTTYQLVFKTDKGTKRVTILSKEAFDMWNEGDTAIKKAGEYFPVKA